MDCEYFRRFMEGSSPSGADSEAVEVEMVQHLEDCQACSSWFEKFNREFEGMSVSFVRLERNRFVILLNPNFRTSFKPNDPSTS